MFVFKLNSFGDPLFYKQSSTLRWPYTFEVTVTTWPVSRGDCKQKLSIPQFSWKPPLNDNNCFKEITVPNIKRTTFKKFKKLTLRNEYYFRIVVGKNKFSENNLLKIIKPPYSLKNYSSNYCNETFEYPFEKNINLSLEISGIERVCRFIKFYNFLLIDKITFTLIYTDKVGFIYFNNTNLLQYIIF